MPFAKGDIVFYEFFMPDETGYKNHPGVILSCDDVYKHEKCYLLAMMTSNGASDKFTFPITDSDLDKPNNKSNSQVRCHLIMYAPESEIKASNPHNKLKKQAFERLITHINSAVFDV